MFPDFEQKPAEIYQLPLIDKDGYFYGMTSCMNDPITGDPMLPPDTVIAGQPCDDPTTDPNFYRWDATKEEWVAEKKPTTCEDFIEFGPVSHSSQTARFNELRQIIQKVSENNDKYRVDRGPELEWIMVKVPEKTAEELALESAKSELEEKKRFLNETDYVVIKIAEGSATKEEYAEVLAEREKARERVRELEVTIANLEGE